MLDLKSVVKTNDRTEFFFQEWQQKFFVEKNA